MKLFETKLDNRCRNFLAAAGVTDVEQLLKLSFDELLTIFQNDILLVIEATSFQGDAREDLNLVKANKPLQIETKSEQLALELLDRDGVVSCKSIIKESKADGGDCQNASALWRHLRFEVLGDGYLYSNGCGYIISKKGIEPTIYSIAKTLEAAQPGKLILIEDLSDKIGLSEGKIKNIISKKTELPGIAIINRRFAFDSVNFIFKNEAINDFQKMVSIFSFKFPLNIAFGNIAKWHTELAKQMDGSIPDDKEIIVEAMLKRLHLNTYSFDKVRCQFIRE